MSKGTKNQFYRYSLRSVCARGMSMCNNIFMLEVLPPDNALTIENLFMRVRVTFDSAVPSGLRRIDRVGIVSEFQPFGQTFQNLDHHAALVVNKTADGNRVIDFTVDMSTLLKKTNIEANQGVFSSSADQATLMYLELPLELIGFVIDPPGTIVYGSIDVWKADAIYTTTEIR